MITSAECRLHLVEIGEHPLRDREERGTGIGWHHASVLSPKQGSAEPSLEVAKLMAEGRRGEVQPPRGACERSGVDDRDHETQMADFDVHGRSTANRPGSVHGGAGAHNLSYPQF
jgi:hypothetical protein